MSINRRWLSFGSINAFRSTALQLINRFNWLIIQISIKSSVYLFYIITMFSNAYEIRERRVKKTIEVLNNDLWPSMRECANHFEIFKSILQNRWNEKAFKFIREVVNKRLFTAQERAIKNYIIRMNEKNLSLTFKLVENAVNYVFRETHLNAAFVKISWAKRFLDCNSDLKRRR